MDSPSVTSTTRRRGRPPAATSDDVLREARLAFNSGRRVDAQAIAETLGISRTSIYRWFGNRDALMGMVLGTEVGDLIDASEVTTGSGAQRVRSTILTVCRTFVRHRGLAAYLDERQLEAVRVLTARDGHVHSVAVARIQTVIENACASASYQPRLEPQLLAFTLVRLIEGFVYTAYDDSRVTLNSDIDQLDQVLQAIL